MVPMTRNPRTHDMIAAGPAIDDIFGNNEGVFMNKDKQLHNDKINLSQLVLLGLGSLIGSG
jgi:hypothetical protein